MGMIDWLVNNLPAIILSVAALIVSVRSWYKTRIFYDLNCFPIGGRGISPQDIRNNMQKIKDLLNTGKYTILNTYEETVAGMNIVYIIVGKVKK